jgi:Family of unknown function (DUF6445)
LSIAPHVDLRVQKLTIGREAAPLLVIDNFVADPDALVGLAAGKFFGDVASYYPGVRSKAPLTYQQFVLGHMRGLFAEYFGLQPATIRFTMCHFSIVTTPPAMLSYLQCIPHIDSVYGNELAFVHYLFKRDHGGTAFYRHRRTGFEVIDIARRSEYFACIEEEKHGPNKPEVRYINGSTALYEEVGRQQGVFNRVVVYRRNSLHSGSIREDFVPDPNPHTGRFSINGFLAGTP